MADLRKAELDVLQAAEDWARAYLKDEAATGDPSSDLVAAVLLLVRARDMAQEKPRKLASSIRKKFDRAELSPGELRAMGFDEDDIPTSPCIHVTYKDFSP